MTFKRFFHSLIINNYAYLSRHYIYGCIIYYQNFANVDTLMTFKRFFYSLIINNYAYLSRHYMLLMQQQQWVLFQCRGRYNFVYVWYLLCIYFNSVQVFCFFLFSSSSLIKILQTTSYMQYFIQPWQQTFSMKHGRKLSCK